MTDAAIMAEGLVRRFGPTEAVAGVDLQVAPGEIYGFLGPNGAGKSTTVRMLVTLISPTAGRAEVAGYDVAHQPGQVRLHIGVALQEAALDPKQTGRELLDLQGRLYGMARAGASSLGWRSWRELVDIGDALDRRIGTYSGGMKRRLDLAAALIHQPSVLFLDEPTTGLDPLSPARWCGRRCAASTSRASPSSSPPSTWRRPTSWRTGSASSPTGRLVAEGTPEELKRAIGADVIMVRWPATPTTVPGAAACRSRRSSESEARGDEIVVSVTDGPTAISPVAVALNGCGVKVDEPQLRTPTLDDVFLEITGGHLQEDER